MELEELEEAAGRVKAAEAALTKNSATRMKTTFLKSYSPEDSSVESCYIVFLIFNNQYRRLSRRQNPRSSRRVIKGSHLMVPLECGRAQSPSRPVTANRVVRLSHLPGGKGHCRLN